MNLRTTEALASASVRTVAPPQTRDAESSHVRLRALRVVAVCVVVALTVALYWPALDFGFWYDDLSPNLLSVESSTPGDLVTGVGTYTAGYYRPVGLLFLWIVVRALGGYGVGWCHGVLVALHAANAVLLGYLIARHTGRTLFGLIAALALALNPLAPEAVAYFAGYFHPLALNLVLLAWVCDGRGLARRSVVWSLGSATLLLLAAGVHEAAVPLGTWTVAIPWLTGRRPWRESVLPTAWLPLLGPAVYMVIRTAVMHGGGLAPDSGIASRWIILSQALAFPAILLAGAGARQLAVLLCFAALGMMITALRPDDRRLWLWGLGWCALALAPSLLFLNTDYVAHGRRLGYVAGAGAAIVWAVPVAALLSGAEHGWRRWLRRALALGIMIPVVVLPVGAIRDQLALYSHTSRIVAATVAAAEDAPVNRPLVFVNLPYYWTPEVVLGPDWDPPLPWFRWAQIILPDYVDAHLLVRANNGPRREIQQVRYPAYAPDVVFAGEEVSASRLRGLAETAQVYVLNLGTATFVDLTAAWQARDSGVLTESEQSLVAPLRSPRELPARGEVESATTLECRYSAGLRLVAAALPAQVLPGDEAAVALYWSLAEPWLGPDPLLRLGVTDGQGEHIYEQATSLVPGLPLSLWDPSQVYVTRLRVPVPASARVGLAVLRVELVYNGEARWPLHGCPAASADGPVSLQWLIGDRTVAEPDELTTGGPPVAVLADGITLVGYALGESSPAPGDCVTLTLFWRADRVSGRDYTVFRQVLSAEGKVVAQADSEPNRGLYPTTAWREGEVVRDAQELLLPDDLPNGDYTILVGMYHWPEAERLAVTSGGDPSQDAVEVSILDVQRP